MIKTGHKHGASQPSLLEGTLHTCRATSYVQLVQGSKHEDPRA